MLLYLADTCNAERVRKKPHVYLYPVSLAARFLVCANVYSEPECSFRLRCSGNRFMALASGSPSARETSHLYTGREHRLNLDGNVGCYLRILFGLAYCARERTLGNKSHTSSSRISADRAQNSQIRLICTCLPQHSMPLRFSDL